jgi:hypothetical protein
MNSKRHGAEDSNFSTPLDPFVRSYISVVIRQNIFALIFALSLHFPLLTGLILQPFKHPKHG